VRCCLSEHIARWQRKSDKQLGNPTTNLLYLTMRKLFWSLVLLCAVAACTGTEGWLTGTAQVEVKPYMIGVAPSHVTVPPDLLFESDSEWEQVAEQTDLYKYYGVQMMQGPGWEWTTHFDPQTLVDFAEARDISIGCEFGDFHLGKTGIPDASEVAFAQIDPIFEVGGEVATLHLDGPVRRMITGIQDNPNAIPLDEVAARLVDFWQKIHAKYPQMRIGLITNLPNWDYTHEFVGYNGDYTDQSGVTYAEVLDAVNHALTEAGETLDFVEVDCPYNYYQEERTRYTDANVDNAGKLTELQAWCEAHDVEFHMIVNAEPRNAGAQGFHDLTVEYVRQLHQGGISPDLFIVQSWYPQPSEHSPETESYTFMNTAKDAIALIRTLYPAGQRAE
jgi:hypothetical protein